VSRRTGNLLTRRVERASALLRDTDLPITDIAFQTGWGSLGTFRAHLPRRDRREPGHRSGRASGPRRSSSAACPPATSAPRTGPTSRSQFRRSDAGWRAVSPSPKKGRSHEARVSKWSVCYVRDQDEALAFYVEKLGFRVHTDVRNGRLSLAHRAAPGAAVVPARPLHAWPADSRRGGRRRRFERSSPRARLPPLVLVVDDCRAAHDRMLARGVEFTQEPMDRYGSVDAGFRDPSGNGGRLIEARR